jgi:hypothetical protein
MLSDSAFEDSLPLSLVEYFSELEISKLLIGHAVIGSSYHVHGFCPVDNFTYSYGENGWGQRGCGRSCNNIPSRLQESNITLPSVFEGGSAHGFLIDQHTNLKGWGSNEYKQLGIEDPDRHLAPSSLYGNKRVLRMAGGDRHSLVMVSETTEDAVYTFGSNQRCQLGLPFGGRPVDPQVYPNISRAKYVFAGAETSFVVTEDGLYVAGDNSEGQLGIGTTETMVCGFREHPYNNILKDAWKIASSKTNGFTLILTTQGRLYSMGRNTECQLGLGTAERNVYIPREIRKPSGVPSDHNFIDVSAGHDHVIVLVGKRTCKNDCKGSVVFPGSPALGVCNPVTGICVCSHNRTGDDCGLRNCPSPKCSGNGDCNLQTGECTCNYPFSGENCNLRRCPFNCWGNGRCDSQRGLCTCFTGFRERDNCRGDATIAKVSILLTILLVVAIIILF